MKYYIRLFKSLNNRWELTLLWFNWICLSKAHALKLGHDWERNGGTFKGCTQLEEVRKLGCAFQRNQISVWFLLFLLSGHHEVSSFTPANVPSLDVRPCHSLEQTGPGLSLPVSQNKSFLITSSLPQVFCHRDKRVMQTSVTMVMNVILLINLWNVGQWEPPK